MLSRSSSSYQPLEKTASGSRRDSGLLETAQTSGAAAAGGTNVAGAGSSKNRRQDQTEMTSIAVVANHPFRANPTTTTTTTAAAAATVASSSNNQQFTICKSTEKTQWTNFHFIMCIGMGGFFIFWIVLLCRMYLPAKFHFWGSTATTEAVNTTTTTRTTAAAISSTLTIWEDNKT